MKQADENICPGKPAFLPQFPFKGSDDWQSLSCHGTVFSSCYTGSYLCDVTETLPHAPCIIQNMVSEHNGTSSCIRYHAVGAGTKQKVVVCLNYPHVALHRDPSSN